jgi:hypothetical protein
MVSTIRRLLIALFLALAASGGGACIAAAELLLLIPIVAFPQCARAKSQRFRDWLAASGLFFVGALIWSPFTWPPVTIGLSICSPVFGLVVLGLDSMIAARLARDRDS